MRSTESQCCHPHSTILVSHPMSHVSQKPVHASYLVSVSTAFCYTHFLPYLSAKMQHLNMEIWRHTPVGETKGLLANNVRLRKDIELEFQWLLLTTKREIMFVHWLQHTIYIHTDKSCNLYLLLTWDPKPTLHKRTTQQMLVIQPIEKISITPLNLEYFCSYQW